MKVVVGFIFGAALSTAVIACLLWIYRLELLNVFSAQFGTTYSNKVEVLQKDMLLFQNGEQVGLLHKGCKVIHIANQELMTYQIKLGWEYKAPHENYFQIDENVEPHSTLIYMNSRDDK